MEITLIFPHQLFSEHPALNSGREVWLLEDPLFFTQLPFHKQKLLLHRASMKFYQHWLNEKGIATRYFSIVDKPPEQSEGPGFLENIFKELKQADVEKCFLADPEDYLLNRRLRRFSSKYNIGLHIHDSPMFLLTRKNLDEMLPKKEGYLMAKFYAAQRKRLKILVEEDGSPVGGKWSFDAENRKKLPKDHIPPDIPEFGNNPFVAEAKDYVNNHFSDNPGNMDHFQYPVTFDEARKNLEVFLQERLHLFGDYEDAISTDHVFIYHSVLTPALNIGLLTPDLVVQAALDRHEVEEVPMNSLEGFIRQIIGWREFMRGMYHRAGVPQRTKNFFGYKRKIPKSFWEGNTGIEPVDHVIKGILKNGYCHHIERLMVLGNFMLLAEFDPDEVYEWFMALFIDAYDWVMVPNVYGMSQYADGGMMTTKPYVSGSNYVRKMSDFKSGDWCKIWDGLYWNFINSHQETFKDNPRMGMMLNLARKMDRNTMKVHQDTARGFIMTL